LDTSLSLQILASLDIVAADFEKLGAILETLAVQHMLTLQIGRTHGQHAVPQTFGRQVLGWRAEIGRCIERLDHGRHVISVGKLSGEIGTSVFIEPALEEYALKRLGLTPDAAPTQVISRDRHAEVLALMAVNAATLCRIATNLSLLSFTEIGELREPFDSDAQEGSSSMPHKRNPELSERVRGLSRRVWSTVQEELSSSVLWLERDISHSSTERFTFPDAFGCLGYSTRLLVSILERLVVRSETMAANMGLTRGAVFASRLLNGLLSCDTMSRTEAYDLVKSLAQQAIDSGSDLYQLASANDRVTSLIDLSELAELFAPDYYVRNIRVAYERSGIGRELG
jgi:adenylosuccinate lyase